MAEETTITLQVPGQPPVTTTPAILKQALKTLKARRRERGEAAIEAAAESRAQAASPRVFPDAVQAAGIAADRLRSLVERIERLEEEKAALAGDIREVFAEAKGAGFDTKIMRQVIKLRRMESDDRQEQETLLDLYKQALGMLS